MTNIQNRYNAYNATKAYKTRLLKDLAGLTIDGISSFARSIDVAIFAAIGWIKSSEKEGFYTHWTRVYTKRFPTEVLSDEVETFNEFIRHLAENEAVAKGTAYEVSRALQQRPEARANKVGYEYILFIGILASLAANVIGLLASSVLTDFMDKKWGTKFETYIGEINKCLKSIIDNLSESKTDQLLDAIDQLNMSLNMLADKLYKRHYKNLHVDIDAVKELNKEIDTQYYFYQLVAIKKGKRSDFYDFNDYSSRIVKEVVEPCEEIIVHLESFKQAVDAMEEPTRKFKRAAFDLR